MYYGGGNSWSALDTNKEKKRFRILGFPALEFNSFIIDILIIFECNRCVRSNELVITLELLYIGSWKLQKRENENSKAFFPALLISDIIQHRFWYFRYCSNRAGAIDILIRYSFWTAYFVIIEFTSIVQFSTLRLHHKKVTVLHSRQKVGWMQSSNGNVIPKQFYFAMNYATIK